MKNLELQKCILGSVYTNCYFLKNKTTGELLIIDPADAPERIVSKVNEMQATPVAILLTHGHFDHIMAVDAVRKKYGISVTELKEINDLSNNTLSIGQKLLVPATTIIIDETTPGEYITYTVKSGDNLYSIANRYGVSVKEIMNLNNLTSNLLNVGQTLRIPTSETNAYIVKSGDNLYSIARRYNTTVDEIKRKNNLVSNNLSIGQSLII